MPEDNPQQGRPAMKRLTGAVFLLVIAGAAAQIVMSSFYLSVAHSPTPHEVPVGLVAPKAEVPAIEAQVPSGMFKTNVYPNTAAMLAAIRTMTIYGGADLTTTPHLYIASAAGTAASNTLRTAFTEVVEQRTQQKVAQLAATQASIPSKEAEALAAPPVVTDVVALPKNDSYGSSIALLVQSIALGATIASMGLGRIGAGTSASLLRAGGHLLALITYAVVSAAVVLAAAHAFGVVPSGSSGRLFWTMALLSLAVTGSVAGLVTLVGAPGAFLGTAYFLFGVPIAGGSVLPPFMPTLARVVGQSLPTGAGVTLVRQSLYFPDASVTNPTTVLAIYAAVGALLVVIGNVLAGRKGRQVLLRH